MAVNLWRNHFEDVVYAFEAAPVGNPDGSKGITLHINPGGTDFFTLGDEVPPIAAITFPDRGPGPYDDLAGCQDGGHRKPLHLDHRRVLRQQHGSAGCQLSEYHAGQKPGIPLCTVRRSATQDSIKPSGVADQPDLLVTLGTFHRRSIHEKWRSADRARRQARGGVVHLHA